MAFFNSEWFWKSSTSEVITRIFEFMGRKLPKQQDTNDVGNVSVRFIMLLLINTIGIINSVILTYRFWNNEYKFDVILNSVVLYFQFCAIIHLIYFPHHYTFIFKVLDRKLYPSDEKYPLNEEQRELIRNINQREKKVHIMFLLFVLAWSLKSLFTMASGIQKLYIKDFAAIQEYDIPMVYITIPIHKLFSQRIPAILVYALLSIIQVLIFILTLEMSANFCFLLTSVVKKLEAEILILRQFVRSIDSRLTTDGGQELYEIDLKRYFKLCVQHHQAIISSIKNVNSAISFMMFPFNNVIAVIVGLELYFLLEGSGNLYNITDVGSAFFTFAIICYMGQGLTDESEQLFHDFTMCTWIEKPNWFRKNVIICMSCSIRLLGLRTALYTINLTNVIRVLQATYSYVNVLWKLK